MPRLTEKMRELTDAQDEEKEKHRKLAVKIMEFSRDRIVVSLRFLDRALLRMPLVSADTIATYGVDGRSVCFCADHVLRSFRQEENRCARAFLHMILHCVFSHPFHCEGLEHEYWNLACDVAVEKVITDLGIPDTELVSDAEGRKVLRRFETDVPILTAEKIYRFLKNHEDEAAAWIQSAGLFERDDHMCWFPKRETDVAERTGDILTTDTRTAMLGCHEADTGEEGADQAEDIAEALVGQSRDEWADVSRHAKLDIETFSREQGFGAGSLLMNLKAGLREKYDYGEFLKKFAVLGEEMCVNQDEFDYIYYTYGLRLYEDMPLVEPLEYRENRRIREFVIALDTSGSCQGATVEMFLQKTYDILKSTESYFQHVNIHIIQCDSDIRKDVRITSQEEFDTYMRDVQLSGFGGTDFRPVFEYVDGMIERHEFQNLRGLIYFTDGRGTFPERAPDYEAAFVFLEEGFAIPEVPPWAIRLVIPEDEIIG